MRIVFGPVPLEPDTLVIASAARREYLALSRDGTYVHHVRPARLDEPIVGDGLRVADELTCDCNGGRFRGTCYQVMNAELFERGQADAVAIPWLDSRVGLDNPAGAGEAVEAARG